MGPRVAVAAAGASVDPCSHGEECWDVVAEGMTSWDWKHLGSPGAEGSLMGSGRDRWLAAYQRDTGLAAGNPLAASREHQGPAADPSETAAAAAGRTFAAAAVAEQRWVPLDLADSQDTSRQLGWHWDPSALHSLR